MAKIFKVNFNIQLLDDIRFCKNNRAKSLVYNDLVNAYDDYGTLLHYAARYDNDEIARYLLKRGSYVDSLGQDNETPLMLALQCRHTATVKVLLEANSNVDLINADGNSALQMIFDRRYVTTEILRLFFKQLQNEVFTEKLVDKLTAARCTLYQATYSGHFRVLESMLQRGNDIESRNLQGKTPLLAAVSMENLRLVEWLIKQGADLNALDERGEGALSMSAKHQNKAMLQLLLKHGANPNIQGDRCEAPLFTLVSLPKHTAEVTECVELLLQYGAIPRNPAKYYYTVFDCAFARENPNLASYFIAQLAMLERKGTAIDKSVMRCKLEIYQTEFDKFLDYYELCEQVLGTAMFRKLSLFALLTNGDFEMRTYARNEAFITKIEEVCSTLELSKLYPYYYKTLMKRIAEAADLVKLENITIPIICGFCDGNPNEYYIAGRKVVGYLKRNDLEQLAQV